MNKLFAAVGVLTLAATCAQAGDPVRVDAPVPATRYVPVLDAYRAEASLDKTPAAAWGESNRIVAGQEGMAHGGHQMHGMHATQKQGRPTTTPRTSTASRRTLASMGTAAITAMI
ncbi:hypothetical protein MJ904_18210 [Massilia sp. MB5]|uniref:hypothetical protein n=1 Tax=Massilia sp. MB5 TaxID=2919578 RepID=UPI001F0E12A9|nr:hypothetical protein [Massilia sp. MB5]UMR29021.1 hypothetical protein MJ904_18210 [Massilia sp. MB5]